LGGYGIIKVDDRYPEDRSGRMDCQAVAQPGVTEDGIMTKKGLLEKL